MKAQWDINDSYGHLAGDDCIRSVADSIKKFSGRVVAACFGGEEFTIILSNAESAKAIGIAECIRLDVESKAIPHESSLIKKTVVGWVSEA